MKKFVIPRRNPDQDRMNREFDVLFEMQDNFESWFPFDETYTEEDKEDAFETYARALLNLSIAEYSEWEYEYLNWLCPKVEEGRYKDSLEYIRGKLRNEYDFLWRSLNEDDDDDDFFLDDDEEY